ncbi:MAG: hypothetical protein A3H93_18440 [Rhodocyclales bacterium RIFCSPLOWO2_02_FULL_63_24]|nr:MAG: hypothetical protein A3H93_18440 [Rhodocyclales bacterium RIFCSPLOWO2_02_FULL_63_24]
MRKQEGLTTDADDLRTNAEAQSAKFQERDASVRIDAGLLYEAHVHRIELEMQNETLRQAKAALEESNDRYIDFYDFAPVGYLTLSAAGLIEEINLTGAEMLGVERDKLLRRRFIPFIEDSGVEDWHQQFLDALRQGAKKNCEVLLRRPDGSCIDVRLDCLSQMREGASSTLRVVMTEITERKQSQARLREALRFKESMLNAVPLGVIATTPDGFITRFNPAAERMLGYTAEEMVGHASVAMLHDPEELAARAGGLPSATVRDSNTDFAVLVDKAQRNEVNQNEWTMVRKDGSRFPALVSSVALRDDAGAVMGFLGVGLDITERKRGEEQLREMAASLEEKVSTRTRQLRAVSAQLNMTEERERRLLAQDLHDDLGQLLAIAKIKLTSLVAGALQPDIDQIVDLVDKAETSVRSLTMQLSPPILRTLGFVPALERLVDDIERVYGLKVHIDNECCRRRLVDEIQAMLYRSVRELLINVARHAKTAEASLACLCDRTKLCIVVSDDGCGFDPERVGGALLGHGSFGLNSICERITNIGGEVDIDSSPGNGTTITLTIPCTIVDMECPHDHCILKEASS